MKKASIVIIFLFVVIASTAQPTIRRALFLGNSYTFVNDLPGLIAQLAHSAGDSLYYEQNTPGGYTLGWNPIAHSTDPISLTKIAQGGWDFVVVQEQSQTPAIPALRDSCMFPASIVLYDSVKSANPCARVLFYLTWGRRFGGQQCFNNYYCSTNFADFFQMQDSVTRSYKTVADSLGAWIAPAGEAWRLNLLLHPHEILHMSDDSHPNLKGSYLAACVFYDVIFGKRSYGLSFQGGLSDTAWFFQMVADTVVYADPSLWNIGNDEPVAEFQANISTDTLFTVNQSINSTDWHWDFGDGNTSDEFEPVHVYAMPGSYSVTLTACNDCRCDTIIHEVVVISTGYPGFNHKQGKFSITLAGKAGVVNILGFSGNGTLTFYDITGKCVGDFPIVEGRSSTGDLPPGLYFWTVENITGITFASGKFIH